LQTKPPIRETSDYCITSPQSNPCLSTSTNLQNIPRPLAHARRRSIHPTAMTTSSHPHHQNLSSSINTSPIPTPPPLISNMFNVLNRFISKLDATPIDEQQSSVSGSYGFQVLRNVNQEVPLEPWFDSIIGINGRTIENPDPSLFATEVRNCAGQTISLGVFSAKVSFSSRFAA
jgi:hypothetical protein